MTLVDVKFNIKSFSLSGSPTINKAELTVEKKFKQLTTVTVNRTSSPTTPTGGNIRKGAATASITFSQADFALLQAALPAVPAKTLPMTLKCEDPNPSVTDSGTITVQSMSLGTPFVPALAHAVVSMLPPPPALDALPGRGALEQIAFELGTLNKKVAEGLELLRALRNQPPKPPRGKNVRTLRPPRSKNVRTLRPRAKTGT